MEKRNSIHQQKGFFETKRNCDFIMRWQKKVGFCSYFNIIFLYKLDRCCNFVDTEQTGWDCVNIKDIKDVNKRDKDFLNVLDVIFIFFLKYDE